MAKERPILFSAPMVRAILDGRKTVTRRILAAPVLAQVPHAGWAWRAEGAEWIFRATSPSVAGGFKIRCPYGAPGDRLWVKESCWLLFADYYTADGERAGAARAVPALQEPGDPPAVWCAVDGPLPDIPPNDYGWQWARRNSIHMPRYASRILLDVVSVRVERLHDISEDDARREGVEAEYRHGPCAHSVSYRNPFRRLWDGINGERAPWASNPWVWRVEFRRTETA